MALHYGKCNCCKNISYFYFYFEAMSPFKYRQWSKRSVLFYFRRIISFLTIFQRLSTWFFILWNKVNLNYTITVALQLAFTCPLKRNCNYIVLNWSPVFSTCIWGTVKPRVLFKIIPLVFHINCIVECLTTWIENLANINNKFV